MPRTAFITGAAQGIGKATARELLTAGWQVVFIDADADAGRETEAEYRPLGDIRFIAADVADADALRSAIDQATAGSGLDLLVNNAAVMDNRPIGELDRAAWERVLAVNLTAPWLAVKFAEQALRRCNGVVVNIASTRALMSEPDTEAYSASKGGLVALTHALAVSLGPAIRVNCISPGWIDVSPWKKRSVREPEQLTEADHRQHPAGRVGVPEDVARMVLFLADPANGFITGQNFVIDGGMTRKMVYV